MQGAISVVQDELEPAPFGDGDATRVDVSVRNAYRFKSRGETVVSGLDLESIIDAIEEAFGLDRHVVAELHDVLFYPVGGMFERHKDTPRTADQLGTLIVEIPSDHAGGAFVIREGERSHTIDWSQRADGNRWVAFYGDVDHRIDRVTEGVRATLVYRLSFGAQRSNPVHRAAIETLADAIIAMIADPEAMPPGHFVIVPCTRLIISDRAPVVPLPLDVLRGEDRAIADTFVRCGLGVTVRELLLSGSTSHSNHFPTDELDSATLIERTLPDEVLAAKHEQLTFSDHAWGEDLRDDVLELGAYMAKEEVLPWEWLVRTRARASYVYEAEFSQSGWFGNEGNSDHIYRAAVMIVTVPPVTICAARPGGACRHWRALHPARRADRDPTACR